MLSTARKITTQGLRCEKVKSDKDLEGGNKAVHGLLQEIEMSGDSSFFWGVYIVLYCEAIRAMWSKLQPVDSPFLSACTSHCQCDNYSVEIA